MERVALFLDHANLQGAFREVNVQVDYLGLRDYLSDGRFLVEAFVYVPINPEHPEAMQGFTDFLRREGFFVRSKLGKRAGDGWKCNLDVEMTIDILRYVNRTRVDIVVIGAGDGDLAPVAHELRQQGIRCEVASTPSSVARELRQACNGFVDLSSVMQTGFVELNRAVAGEEVLVSGS